MKEIWKDILEYEGFYQASNWGRVKSLGNGKTHKAEKIMKLKLDDGYYRIQLCKNGKYRCFRVHRLVWEAFNGPIPEGMQINHNNEVKTDNRIENLSLMSAKENCNWGTRNGRIINNRTGNNAPKPVIQYDLQGNFIAEWTSTKEVERQLGYFNSSIVQCCNGKLKTAYSHIWRYK